MTLMNSCPLRLTGTNRVWCIRQLHLMKVLWWVPHHEICPALTSIPNPNIAVQVIEIKVDGAKFKSDRLFKLRRKALLSTSSQKFDLVIVVYGHQWKT